ncbi:MAG: Crp/Fnr family transcriptional regulator [Deltaproteobacteria bacterium]|nr:Crp/Fnr family transcriptional regulator [Deltaproteobacteria bacterium]
MSKLWLLQNLRIFENLSKKDIGFIDNLSKMEYYKENDTIYLGESQSSHIYILKKGNIKITLSTEQGKEFIVEILKPDEIFGNFGDYAFGSEASFDFLNAENAFALTDAEVCKFKKDDFDKILNIYPVIGNRVLKLIGLRFKYISTKITSLAYKSLDARISEVLIYLADNFGVKEGLAPAEANILERRSQINIKFKLTHEEISNLTGASRQRTTIVLGKLKDLGIIDFRKKKIIIKDLDKLKEIAGLQ